MRIKGSALLARKEIVTHRFGAAAWSELVDQVAKTYPYFRAPILASSLIPIDEFLAFHDALLARFFKGDDRAYFELGYDSAKWALTTGPYKRFLARKDIRAFVESIPNLSSAYWETPATSYGAELDGRVVRFRVTGLPRWHAYFEYLVVGYIRAALELMCGGAVEMKCLKGGSGIEFQYEFRLPKA